MFDNIGQQIKWFAKMIFWIGLAVTWIVGIKELLTMEGYMILVSIIVSIVCSGFAYIVAMLFYAFGELVDSVTKIANQNRHE